MTYFWPAVAAMLYVFLRSLQQLNVMRERYAWILPTSVAMAATDVFVIAVIAAQGWNLPLVLVLGVSGGIGSIFAVLFHKKFVR